MNHTDTKTPTPGRSAPSLLSGLLLGVAVLAAACGMGAITAGTPPARPAQTPAPSATPAPPASPTAS